MNSQEQTGRGAPLTNPAHWEATWAHIEHRAIKPDSTFDPVLGALLPKNDGLTALEIGCYPGSYMAYLSHRFGYRVSGLDFMTDLSKLRGPLEAAGTRVDELIEADFLTYRPSRTWDVVSSFGFVEHFEDLDFVIARHVALVSPGGYLVIEVPYFRGMQYLLRKAFQPRLLDSHNLEAMRPDRYRAQLRGAGLEVLHCDFFRTFEFWISPSGPRRQNPLLNRAVNVGSRLVRRSLQAARLDNVPNRWLSPYLVVVARKGMSDSD